MLLCQYRNPKEWLDEGGRYILGFSINECRTSMEDAAQAAARKLPSSRWSGRAARQRRRPAAARGADVVLVVGGGGRGVGGARPAAAPRGGSAAAAAGRAHEGLRQEAASPPRRPIRLPRLLAARGVRGFGFFSKGRLLSSLGWFLRDCKYKGPAFSSLDPQLQEALKQYLASRGINTELTNFLLQHLQRKEHAQYVNWLRALESAFAKDA
uniref:Uncharacterized protein n=1 Tax=Ananas comosus var. bracteatus TaxID=296719 RepID=A0A6V7NF12_ANACO|nr:unnamed protein product [Ananas comosus var. bracteatus]